MIPLSSGFCEMLETKHLRFRGTCKGLMKVKSVLYQWILGTWKLADMRHGE